ncbi:uncharacterized protein [Dysidea avara]|uniref:uncharacterized protein n=1 Tax=Dysidea avara TaxID=196820 RepID=UPI00331D86F5
MFTISVNKVMQSQVLVSSQILCFIFIGIQIVNNLMATDNCLNVNTSWTTITGGCSNSVQYMITLSSSSDTIGPVVTSDASYTFNNTVMLSDDISVIVVAFNRKTMGISMQVAAQPSLLNIPQLIDPTMVERCVSYLYITWNDTTQCVPVHYTVMLTNTSSGVVIQSISTDSNSYNFTGLTSDTSYTITIVGRNRVGQDVVVNHTSSLKSNVPPMFVGVTPSSIVTSRQQVEDITISWMAPSILNLCTTSLISSYEVQINYTNNDGRSTDSSSVPGNITSVLMSDLFLGHPLPGTTYNITVVAVNEAGHGVANTPTCDCGSSDEDDDLSTGAVVAITLVVTFIITLVVTAVMTYIITRMYYKRQPERTNNNKNVGTQDNNQFVLMGRNVEIDTNPSYAIMDKDTIKMDTNPAYAVAK